jgi:hypothetical protein
MAIGEDGMPFRNRVVFLLVWLVSIAALGSVLSRW